MSQTEKTGFLPRRIALLGASGNIGRQALDVIAASKGRLIAELLSVHSNVAFGVQTANLFGVKTLVITDSRADQSALSELNSGIEVLIGADSLDQAVKRPEIDVILAAIVGSAGLSSVHSALEAGKTIALANKESLVISGELAVDLVRNRGGRLIPVDSEHSAIFQCLYGRNPESKGLPLDTNSSENSNAIDEVARLILTASGGPFRTYSRKDLKSVTVQQALCHPTWHMGHKITIDSATLMNKAFEMIEAHWLFGLPAEKIIVMIHPQSLIHSMVEFIDGAILAQIGPPDMRLPIQLALTAPARFNGPMRKLDWTHALSIQMEPVDPERFPAIDLGYEIIRAGGTTGAVVNAANEIAVHAFLNGKISFDRIVTACQTVLNNHYYEAHPNWDRLLEIDRWAREETKKWISY